MGEAKRRKLAAAAMVKPSDADLGVLCQALLQVLGAVTSFQGSDCIAYALVGAEALRRRGVHATPVAGYSTWRVGPGDGDVISHNPTHTSNAFAPGGSLKAGMFHAWIRCGEVLVDFTTSQLEHKALLLDQSDGGKTDVQWSPPYLWVAASTCMSPEAVAAAAGPGVYSYVRSRQVEDLVLADTASFDANGLADSVDLAMTALENGNLLVFGVGDGVLQDAGNAAAASLALGMVPTSNGFNKFPSR